MKTDQVLHEYEKFISSGDWEHWRMFRRLAEEISEEAGVPLCTVMAVVMTSAGKDLREYRTALRKEGIV